uniref:serine/threonine-protein kinase n=2 Tax=Streptomyces TaxID=1883 RepID=UPI0008533990
MTGAVPKPLRAEDPREVSGYRLLARIGEGGMGTVYLSRSRGGQPVALKLIRAEYTRDPHSTAAFRERFAREVAAARRVSGYHLVPVVDHDAGAERPWLATRYVPGVPLDDALKDHGPLAPSAVLRLAAGVAYALDAVHTAGVVHRDVKPGNVLLASDGPWLLDFGIARAAGAATLTTVGRLVGTPRYMSPEHALGRPVSSASDVFALGLVIAEAASGRHPYGRGNGLAVAARIAGTDREPPALDGVPDPLRELASRCLAARPEDRPTPSALAHLCGWASPTPVRDFTAWLPVSLAADVSHVESVASDPPPPRVPLSEADTVRALPPTAPFTLRD